MCIGEIGQFHVDVKTSGIGTVHVFFWICLEDIKRCVNFCSCSYGEDDFDGIVWLLEWGFHV